MSPPAGTAAAAAAAAAADSLFDAFGKAAAAVPAAVVAADKAAGGVGEVDGLLSCRHTWLTDTVACTSRRHLQHVALVSAITAQEEAKAAGTVTFHQGTCGHLTGSGTH